jgi:hypothetical protein
VLKKIDFAGCSKTPMARRDPAPAWVDNLFKHQDMTTQAGAGAATQPVGIFQQPDKRAG